MTEPLEPRRLLAGVTLFTHGLNGNVAGWVGAAAEATAERVGGARAASIYTMTVGERSGRLAVTSFAPDSGQRALRDTSAGEIVVKLDWGSVSGGRYATQTVARAVADYMLVAHGDTPALAELPLHLAGHSRGASLVSALSEDFGEAGVFVDQVTYLDPVPVDGVGDFLGVSFGDQGMAVYDNTVFADNYWRSDGNPNNNDFDGQAVAGTYNGDLNSTVQRNFFVSAHGAVTAYYVGTIDTDTSNGGDHPVLDSWYPGTAVAPGRDETGFANTRIAANSRASSGLSTALGGRARRVGVGESGSQWANVVNFTTGGERRVTAGQTLDARVQYADRDSRLRVDVFADNDTNPYNDGLTLLTRKKLSGTTLAGGRISVGTGPLEAGTYRLAARATDDSGHTRWVYSPRSIGVTAAPPPDFVTFQNRVMTVTGTDAADVIGIVRNDGSYDVTLNGINVVVDQSDADRIDVQAGGGNDTVRIDAAVGTYVNAGPGFDDVVGGDGSDTLSGGAQSDTLTGGLGDDVLNGNGGNNLLVGNGGYDRFYSADGAQDTMVGGSNADRFFGGNGPDSMIGGPGNDKIYANAGNDTLIGGPGTDIVNGGAGSDSSDDDPLDLRTDIEILV